MKENNHPYEEQGKRIKLIRKQLRLSQKDMAKDLDVQPGSLSDVERGRRNISRTLEIKLVELYKISINYLRYGTLPIFESDETPTAAQLQEPETPYSNSEQSEKIKELEAEVKKLQAELLQAKDEIIRLLTMMNNK